MVKSIINRQNLREANYFDDFFSSDSNAKEYSQILFRPGRPVQNRELTQLQTLLMEKGKTFLDTYFKNGSIIEGLYLSIENIENKWVLKASEGLIYYDGTVFKTKELSYEVDPLDLPTLQNEKKDLEIGIKVHYSLVDSYDDADLKDPAVKYYENEGLVGADRLLIHFSLVKKEDILLDVEVANNKIHQYFDYAWAELIQIDPDFVPDGLIQINNVKYFNRKFRIQDIFEKTASFNNEIVDGLSINLNNLVDIKLSNKNFKSLQSLELLESLGPNESLDLFNLFYRLSTLSDYPESTFTPVPPFPPIPPLPPIYPGFATIPKLGAFSQIKLNTSTLPEDWTVMDRFTWGTLPIKIFKPERAILDDNKNYIIVKKGVGKIRDEHVPMTENKVLKVDKPIYEFTGGEDNFPTFYDKVAYHKNSESSESGIYFKMYYDNKDFAFFGMPLEERYSKMIDVHNVYPFILPGRKILIQKYNATSKDWDDVAKANICSLQSEPIQEQNHDWIVGKSKCFVNLTSDEGKKIIFDDLPEELVQGALRDFNCFIKVGEQERKVTSIEGKLTVVFPNINVLPINTFNAIKKGNLIELKKIDGTGASSKIEMNVAEKEYSVNPDDPKLSQAKLVLTPAVGNLGQVQRALSALTTESGEEPPDPNFNIEFALPILDVNRFQINDPIVLPNINLNFKFEYHVTVDNAFNFATDLGSSNEPVPFYYSYTYELYSKVFFHNIEFLGQKTYEDLEPEVYYEDDLYSKPTRIVVENSDLNGTFNKQMFIEKGIKIRRTEDTKYDIDNNTMFHEYAKIPNPFVRKVLNKTLTTIVEFVKDGMTLPIAGIPNWGSITFNANDKIKGAVSIYGTNTKSRTNTDILGGPSGTTEFNYKNFGHTPGDPISVRSFVLTNGDGEQSKSMIISGPRRDKVSDLVSVPTLEQRTTRIIKDDTGKFWLEVPEDELWLNAESSPLSGKALYPGDYITLWFENKPYFVMVMGPDAGESLSEQTSGSEYRTSTLTTDDEFEGILLSSTIITENYLEAITNLTRNILQKMVTKNVRLDYDICRVAWEDTNIPEEDNWEKEDLRRKTFFERAVFDIYNPNEEFLVNKNYMPSAIFTYDNNDYDIDTVFQTFHIVLGDSSLAQNNILTLEWALRTKEAFFIEHNYSILDNSLDNYIIKTGMALEFEGDYLRRAQFPIVSTGVGGVISELDIAPSPSDTNIISLFDYTVSDKPIPIQRAIGVQFFHWAPKFSLPLQCIDAFEYEDDFGYKFGREHFLHVYTENAVDEKLEASEWKERQFVKQQLFNYQDGGNFWKKYEHNIDPKTKKIFQTDTILSLSASSKFFMTVYKEIESANISGHDYGSNPSNSYANIMAENERFIQKDLITQMHKPYIIAKERFEQKQRITETVPALEIIETEGKVLNYRHKAVHYHLADPLENQSREIRGYQTFEYDVVLPEMVNVYMNDEGKIETLIGQPTFLKNFAPIFNNEKLYLGTFINPPVYRDLTTQDNSRDLNFITIPKYFKNFNEEVFKKIESYQLHKKIDLNKQTTDLMKVHEYNRRDAYITSTNNETVGDYQYIEKGTLESHVYEKMQLLQVGVSAFYGQSMVFNFNKDIEDVDRKRREIYFDIKYEPQEFLQQDFPFPTNLDYYVNAWYNDKDDMVIAPSFLDNLSWRVYINHFVRYNEPQYRERFSVNVFDKTNPNLKVSGRVAEIRNLLAFIVESASHTPAVGNDVDFTTNDYTWTGEVDSVNDIGGDQYEVVMILNYEADNIPIIQYAATSTVSIGGNEFTYNYNTMTTYRYQRWFIDVTGKQPAHYTAPPFPPGNPWQEFSDTITDENLGVEFIPMVAYDMESKTTKRLHRKLKFNDVDLFKDIKVGESLKIFHDNQYWSFNVVSAMNNEVGIISEDLDFPIYPYQRKTFYVMKPLITEHEHYKRTQTFMNPKIFNIYNSLISNDYIDADEFILKDDNQDLTSMKWSYDSSLAENPIPTTNLHNNEILPKAETMETKRLSWLSNEFIKMSADGIFVTIRPNRYFKIVETLNYKTDSLDFNLPILGHRETFIINNVDIRFRENSVNKKDINTVLLYDTMELDESANHQLYLKDNTFIEEDYFSIQSIDDSRKDEDFNYIFNNKIYPVQTALKRFNYNRLFLTPRLCPINKKMLEEKTENYSNIEFFRQLAAHNLTIPQFYTAGGLNSFTALSIDNFNFAPKTIGYSFQINDLVSINKFTDTCVYLVDGIYKVGFINGRNCSLGDTNSYIMADETKPWQIDRTLTKMKNASSFGSFSDEYDFIFKQINKPIMFQTYDIPYIEEELGGEVPDSEKSEATKHYELLKKSDNGLNAHEFLDELKDEYWKTILPNVYQSYQFDESYMLRNVDIFIDPSFVGSNHYEGRVAIYFGFLINNKLTENGIIHTEIVRFKNGEVASSVMIKEGKISIDLETPINIPKDSQFFIGFLKEQSLVPNAEIELFYLDNGSYDHSVTQTQISYPANFNSRLMINNTNFNHRLLKIDLSVDSYSDLDKEYVEVFSPNLIYNEDPNSSNFISPFDRIMLIGEDYQMPGTSIQYFYSIDGQDITEPTKVWFECYLNDEIVFDETQTIIAFKSVLRTTNENISPIIKSNTTLHFKSYCRVKNEPMKWLGEDIEMTNCPIQLQIRDLKFKMNYSDIVLDDNIIQKDMSSFSQVYRIIIDFIKPELNTFDFKLSEFKGIPIIFRDGDTGEIIEKFTTWTEIPLFVNFPIFMDSSEETGGLFKLPKFSLKPILRHIRVPIYLGEEVICNSDGSLWYGDSMKFGQNEKTQLNLFGQVYYIQKLNNEEYRQVYEFCGLDFEKHPNIIAEIKVPVIEGGDLSNKVKVVKIRNISFSSDMLVDNKEKIVMNWIYRPLLTNLNTFKFISPKLFNFSVINNVVGTFGGLNFGKENSLTSQMASSLGKFSSVKVPMINPTFRGIE